MGRRGAPWDNFNHDADSINAIRHELPSGNLLDSVGNYGVARDQDNTTSRRKVEKLTEVIEHCLPDSGEAGYLRAGSGRSFSNPDLT